MGERLGLPRDRRFSRHPGERPALSAPLPAGPLRVSWPPRGGGWRGAPPRSPPGGPAGVRLGLSLGAAAVTVALSGHSGRGAALPGAGLVAVAFAPVRAAAQRVITRRLFGTGGDPQLVLHRLGLRLEASDDPESLLAAVVDTAAESLRLPYVAVELWSGTGWQATRPRGRRPPPVDSLDISVGNQAVRRLVVP